MKDVDLSKRWRGFRKRLIVYRKDLSLSLQLIRRSTLSMVGLGIVIGYILLAIIGPFFSPYDPLALSVGDPLTSPSSSHLFGVDVFGRDVFSRVLHGAPTSLIVAIVVLLVAVTLGTLLGVIAGYFGGYIGEVIMRVTDIFLALPAFVLAIAISAALGPSLTNTMLALTIVWWPYYARVVRSQVLIVRETDYVKAEKIMGASDWYIILHHILPNSLAPVLVLMTLDFGYVILLSAALSFIGLGAQPPAPEWGLMVAEGREYFPYKWWVATFPGIAIFLVAMGFNMFGDALRDILEPRERRRLEVRV